MSFDLGHAIVVYKNQLMLIGGSQSATIACDHSEITHKFDMQLKEVEKVHR